MYNKSLSTSSPLQPSGLAKIYKKKAKQRACMIASFAITRGLCFISNAEKQNKAPETDYGKFKKFLRQTDLPITVEFGWKIKKI